KNINTFNPVKVATHEYVAIAKDIRAAGSWRERAGRVFRGPGWAPAPAVEQAEESVAA
ncbi:sterol desaturase family protein, partial [Streptomyces sp. NPDC002172]